MGVVYRARDQRLDRQVALKFLSTQLSLDTAARERFIHEARTASKLDHPNIGVVHEIGETEQGQFFIAMACYEGETLKQKIEGGPLPLETCLDYATQIAEGLSSAHRKGIIHRDVKPANIIVTTEEVVKIVDFGLAKMADLSLTQSGTTLGTVVYMSPEQAAGREVDQRTDLWSLGVVLYEMLTGERPFKGDYEQALLYAILNEEPEPVRTLRADVPEALEEAVEITMKKEPEARCRSAEDLLRVLQPLRQGRGGTAAGTRTRWPRAARYSGMVAVLLLLLFIGSRFLGKQPAEKETIAVLPLVNYSGDPEHEYFADGMTEALIAGLAQYETVHVVSRTSAMQYKKTEKTLPEIARELKADVIVEGSVYREGEQVRITAQAIRASTDQHLWSQSFDRDLKNILSLQNEIARTVAYEIGGKLSSREQPIPMQQRPVDAAAYEAYLKGIYDWYGGDWGASVASFEKSIELDPEYASPYAHLARLYYWLGFFGWMPPDEAFGKVHELATNALKRDPNHAEAHSWMALHKLHYEWDFHGAEKHFRKALQTSPGDADIRHHYAHLLLAMGRTDESLTESMRSVELNPLDPMLVACLGWHSLYEDRYDQAEEYAKRAIQISENAWWGKMVLGWSYGQRGRFDEAAATFETAGSGIMEMTGRARALAQSGRREEAVEILTTLEAQAKETYSSPYYLAALHLSLGSKDEAMAYLEKAFEERAGFLVHVGWDPNFKELRTDPRFTDLLKRIGLPPTLPGFSAPGTGARA